MNTLKELDEEGYFLKEIRTFGVEGSESFYGFLCNEGIFLKGEYTYNIVYPQ